MEVFVNTFLIAFLITLGIGAGLIISSLVNRLLPKRKNEPISNNTATFSNLEPGTVYYISIRASTPRKGKSCHPAKKKRKLICACCKQKFKKKDTKKKRKLICACCKQKLKKKRHKYNSKEKEK